MSVLFLSVLAYSRVDYGVILAHSAGQGESGVVSVLLSTVPWFALAFI